MRTAIPASLGLHFGLVIAAWLVTQVPAAVDQMSAESVSVEILSVESFVSASASEVPTEATETLVSSGAEAATPSEPQSVEAVETALVAAAAPAEAIETDAPVSAEVLTASIAGSVPVAAALSLRFDPAAALAAAKPIELAPADVARAEPVGQPALEPLVEAAAVVPMPKPRILRKPVEDPAGKPVRKAAEKPAKPAVAGNGGKAEADSTAAAASGGTGKANDGGSAAVGKYPGQVQSKVTRAAKYPAKAKGAKGEAEVRFTLDAGGRVLKLSLARSSGNAALDAAALAAVERAAPFPPIPEGAGRASWSFTVPLLFRK